MKIAELQQINKYYEMNEECIFKALDGVDLTIDKGKFQAIVGTSGSLSVAVTSVFLSIGMSVSELSSYNGIWKNIT